MLTLLIILLWITLLYGTVAIISTSIRKIQDKREQRSDLMPRLPFGILSVIVSVSVLFMMSFVVVVDPKDVGVVITPKGVSDEPIHAGWNFVAPWNSVKPMDKTIWVYSLTQNSQEGAKRVSDAIWAPTKDGIKMGYDISVSWRIDAQWAPWIYQNVDGQDTDDDVKYKWIEDNIIRVKAKSGLAAASVRFTPIEVYSNKREEIQILTKKFIDHELKTFHLVCEQVDIREIYYNPDYEKAINQKKLAEQEVLRLIEVTKQKEEQLKQAVINKNMAIEQAKGESEALKIKGQSISDNPKIIELEWINKWNGSVPNTILSSGGQNMMMMINPNAK